MHRNTPAKPVVKTHRGPFFAVTVMAALCASCSSNEPDPVASAAPTQGTPPEVTVPTNTSVPATGAQPMPTTAPEATGTPAAPEGSAPPETTAPEGTAPPEPMMPPDTAPTTDPTAMPTTPMPDPDPPDPDMMEPPKDPASLKLLVYSLIGDRRILNSPVCQKDGTQCTYNSSETAKGYVHKAIGRGNAVIKALAETHGFEVKIYEGGERDSVTQEFVAGNLEQYDAIIFNNPNGLALNEGQRAAFKGYINQGGAYVGIHAGINCEKDWEWFHNFVGAFETGVVNISNAKLAVSKHVSTEGLPEVWEVNDEWHKHSRAADTQPGVTVLLRRNDWPVAWLQEFDGGRMWYTGLGHTDAAFNHEAFSKHVWGGIQWATGITGVSDQK